MLYFVKMQRGSGEARGMAKHKEIAAAYDVASGCRRCGASAVLKVGEAYADSTCLRMQLMFMFVLAAACVPSGMRLCMPNC